MLSRIGSYSVEMLSKVSHVVHIWTGEERELITTSSNYLMGFDNNTWTHSLSNTVVSNSVCDHLVFLSAMVCAQLVTTCSSTDDASQCQIPSEVVELVNKLKKLVNVEIRNAKQALTSGYCILGSPLSIVGHQPSVNLSAYRSFDDCIYFRTFQDELAAEMTEWRQVMHNIVRVKSPLDFNPYRDAIFATTVGCLFNQQEAAAVMNFLDQSASAQVLQMFQETAEKHHIDPSVSSEELMLYFACLGVQMDLTGALTCAIDHRVDCTIDKYMVQPAHYFVGQTLVFTGLHNALGGMNGSESATLTAEIVRCEKPNTGEFDMHLQSAHGLFVMNVQVSTRFTNTVRVNLSNCVSRELGKFLYEHTNVDSFNVVHRSCDSEPVVDAKNRKGLIQNLHYFRSTRQVSATMMQAASNYLWTVVGGLHTFCGRGDRVYRFLGCWENHHHSESHSASQCTPISCQKGR